MYGCNLGVKTPLKEKQSPPQNQAASNNKAKRNTNPPFPNNPSHTTYAKAATGGAENGLSFARITSPTHKQQQQQQQQLQQQSAPIDLGTSPLANFIASNNLAQLKGALPGDIKEIESQRQQQSDPNLQALLKKPAAMNASKPNAIGPNAPNTTTPGKPAKLMPPTMFETTGIEPCSGVGGGAGVGVGIGSGGNTGNSGQRTGALNANQKAGKNESNETSKKNSMQKGKETGNPKSRKKSSHEQQPQVQQNEGLTTAAQPLTETQLLQAISYLMKNDPSFIRKIHEAYLKSFAEMVSQ